MIDVFFLDLKALNGMFVVGFIKLRNTISSFLKAIGFYHASLCISVVYYLLQGYIITKAIVIHHLGIFYLVKKLAVFVFYQLFTDIFILLSIWLSFLDEISLGLRSFGAWRAIRKIIFRFDDPSYVLLVLGWDEWMFWVRVIWLHFQIFHFYSFILFLVHLYFIIKIYYTIYIGHPKTSPIISLLFFTFCQISIKFLWWKINYFSYWKLHI